MVGLTGFEPVTSRLSGERSNQLSYRPLETCILQDGPSAQSHAKSRLEGGLALHR